MKKLSICAVFVVPNCMNLTSEQIDIVMLESIKKFQGMSTHIPNLLDEFAIVLVAVDDQNIPVAVVRVAWLTAEKDSCMLTSSDKMVGFYDLKVVGIFSESEFEEEFTTTSGKKSCSGIIIKNSSLFS